MNGSPPKKPGQPSQPLPPPDTVPLSPPRSPSSSSEFEDSFEECPGLSIPRPDDPGPGLSLPVRPPPSSPAPPVPPAQVLARLENQINGFQQNLLKTLHPNPNTNVGTTQYRSNLLLLEAFKALLGTPELATKLLKGIHLTTGRNVNPEVLTFLENLLPDLPAALLDSDVPDSHPVLEIDASGLTRGGLKGEKLWNDATAGGRFTGNPHSHGLRLATETPTTRDLVKAGGLFEYWRAGEMRRNLEKMKDSVEALQNGDLSTLQARGCAWASSLLSEDQKTGIAHHFQKVHTVFTNGGGAGHKVAANAVRAHIQEHDRQNLTVVQPLAIIYAMWLWTPRKVDWILTDSLSSQNESQKGRSNHYRIALEHISNYVLKSPTHRQVRPLPYTTVHYWHHASDDVLDSEFSRHPVTTLLFLFAAQTKSGAIPAPQEVRSATGDPSLRWTFQIRPTLGRRTQTFLLGLFRHPSHVGLGFRKAARDMDVLFTLSGDGQFALSLSSPNRSQPGPRTTLWKGKFVGDAPAKMCAPAPAVDALLTAPLPTWPAPEYYQTLQSGEEKQTNSKRCPPILFDLITDFRETCLAQPELLRRVPGYTVDSTDGPDHELVNIEILTSDTDSTSPRVSLSGMQLRGGGATVAEQLAWRERDETFLIGLPDLQSGTFSEKGAPVSTLNYATMGSSPGYQQVIDYVSSQLENASRWVTQTEKPLRVYVIPLGFMDNATVIPTLGLMSRCEVALEGGSDHHHVIPLCGRTEALLGGDKKLEPFCLDLLPAPPFAQHPSSLIRPLPGLRLSEDSVVHIKAMFPFLDLHHDKLRSQ